ENFAITGISLSSLPKMIQSFAWVKKSAAKANRDCGVLAPKIAEAIVHACDQVLTGKYDDQFPSDLIQGGAGTSVNMNANEVTANLALEYLGHEKGEYQYVQPNNHVNYSQSTNDTYPTAFRIALYYTIEEFCAKLGQLPKAFAAKGVEFKGVLKMGRT